MKFILLWKAAQEFDAKLFLMNYAKKGTKHQDEVLVIEVLELQESGIVSERVERKIRGEFGVWFRNLNNRCSSSDQ